MALEIQIPPLLRVRQKLEGGEIPDVAAELKVLLDSSPVTAGIKSGMRVALTAGSRGIDRIDEVLKEVVTWLRDAGAEPFIVPAMGSHAGATAGGQTALLKEFGISEEKVGAPIHSSMETEIIGTVQGIPVYLDKQALCADGIVVINRIKPHTSFHGPYESGLAKMLAVGLGKQKGASAVHALGPSALRKVVPGIAEFVLKRVRVFFGVALIENGRDRLARIEVIPGDGILDQEPELLKESYRLMPRLPFRGIDVLIVDQFGKSKSGTGLDTNVIGRMGLRGEPEPDDPFIHRIVVLDLAASSGASEGSEGSAYGIGLADITTKRVLDKMDLAAMRENALASTFVERARVPLWFDTDVQAIEAGIRTSWCPDVSRLRLARIHDTLSLEEIILTRPLYEQASGELEIIGDPEVSGGPELLCFDDKGNLGPW